MTTKGHPNAIDEIRKSLRFALESDAGGRILGVLCALVLCGILTAGLWPFHAPANGVTWLNNANGLRFGPYGTLQSAGMFPVSNSSPAAGASLEIWLESRRLNDSSTILAFYDHGTLGRFSLRQSHADAVLGIEIRNATRAGVYIDDVFRKGMPAFLTIAASSRGTAVYVDGALRRWLPEFVPSRGAFAGRLVVGDSPVESDSWSGRLYGLAIYSGDLTADQVLRHYRTWTATGRPGLSQNDRAAAVYPFRERMGNVVHDDTGGTISLFIPARYTILDEKFLEPPWREFAIDWGYWKNVSINIGGFIPLGFVFYAYLSRARRAGDPAFTAIAAGGFVSLAIEFLQAFLPTRQSGMTDLITNTLGTCIGVALCRQVKRWDSVWIPESNA